jgi:hypothetical protein
MIPLASTLLNWGFCTQSEIRRGGKESSLILIGLTEGGFASAAVLKSTHAMLQKHSQTSAERRPSGIGTLIDDAPVTGLVAKGFDRHRVEPAAA